MMTNPWTTRSSREVYDNPWIRVVENQVVDPSGADGIYGVVHYKNLAVGVIPVDDLGHTWIVGQYRYALDLYSWEIPQGGGPEGESPEDCAHRELAEETGLRARRLVPILEMHLSNCASDERSITFLALGIDASGPAFPDGNEAPMDIRRLPLSEAIAMVHRGEITDSPSVGGLLKLAATAGDHGLGAFV